MTAYPHAPRSDIVDVYHGTPVADPYRPLEDPAAPETRAFVAAQNELTQAFLSEIPARARFHERLTQLWDFPRYSAPQHKGGRYFYSLNDGLQNQPPLYVTEQLDERGRVLLDPNVLSPDGTVALTNISPSDDGRLLAYSLSASGSDWQEIRVRDTQTATDRPDVIRWCKFTDIAWLHDGSGFFYARYPSPDERAAGPLAGEPDSTHQRVYFHRLGDDQSHDALVYARPDARDLGFDPRVSDDGRYLILRVWEGTDPRTRIYYRPIDAAAPDGGEFIRLLDAFDARYDFVGSDGPVFYFLTDLHAPNGRVIAIDTRDQAREQWREIVPEQAGALDFGAMARGRFILVRLVDASHRVELYTLEGRPAGDIPLPDLGAVLELQARPSEAQVFLQFTSFLYPPTVIRHDLDTGETGAVWTVETPLDPAAYVTRQEFAVSRDGTRFPIFLVHQKGLVADGRRPTLLYGYGGFNIPIMPGFSPGRALWLERGGVYAIATLRGGQEYGETWHQAGMLDRKQNVFDDFIAAAEWLIASQITSPRHLAIDGRSNGGLLTAACLTQRPDLYGAVHCGVPVIDMLRYHRFSAGRYWTPEYGNAEENPDHFRFLLAYSPLHNVRPGVRYPPVIITTADTDDRVVPMHALKFAAALQAAEEAVDPSRPALIRIETKAGHGLGKPTSKLIEETADVYAFLWQVVGGQDESFH